MMLPIEVEAMKLGRLWEHEPPAALPLGVGCKRLRRLATAGDMKSFIRKGAAQGKGEVTSLPNKEPPQGGTRWNPTHEQIGILERLYHGGMRTPTAEQIEHIARELSKYGRIEGKNVFYWFQNHKARERQKLKQKLQHDVGNFTKEEAEANLSKRKCEPQEFMKHSSKSAPHLEEDEDQRRTLQLFPLNPERRIKTLSEI